MLRSQKLEIKSVEIRGGFRNLLAWIRSKRSSASNSRRRRQSFGRWRNSEWLPLRSRLWNRSKPRRGTPSLPVTSWIRRKRERQEILGKARLGNFLLAVIDGKAVQGAESELRSAYDLTGDHEIPHELFEAREAKEKRAATDAPATGTQVNEQPVQPFIYKEGVAGFLGIDMPQVGGGTAFSSRCSPQGRLPG